MSLGPYGLGGRPPRPSSDQDSLSERIGLWFLIICIFIGTPAFLLFVGLSGAHR